VQAIPHGTKVPCILAQKTMKKHSKLTITVVSILLLVSIILFNPFIDEAEVNIIHYQSEQEIKETGDVIEVEFNNVKPSIGHIETPLFGTIIVDNFSVLSSQENSLGVEVFVHLGDIVKKNQLLAKLDVENIRRKLQESTIKKASIISQASSVKLKKDLLQGKHKLYESQYDIERNLAAKEKVIDSKIGIENNKITFSQLQFQLSEIEKDILYYKEALVKSSFRALSEGIVTSVKVKTGQEYFSGEDILTIAYKGDFFVEFYAYDFNDEFYSRQSFILEGKEVFDVRKAPNMNSIGMNVYQAKLQGDLSSYTHGASLKVKRRLYLKEDALLVNKADIVNLNKIYLIDNADLVHKVDVNYLGVKIFEDKEYAIVHPKEVFKNYAVIKSTYVKLKSGTKVKVKSEG
jgi:hypothetical protein